MTNVKTLWRNYAAYSLTQTLNKNHVTPSELINKIKALGGETLYHCFYELEQRESFKDYSGLMRPAFGLVHIDLDDKQNAGRDAFTDTKALVKILQSENIPHTCFFSGNKGFHVSIPAKAFGLSEACEQGEDKVILETKIKNILVNLQKTFPTVDTGIFNANRKFRAWNSKHEKSGLYKIALTHSDLELSLNTIKHKASRIQPLKAELLDAWLHTAYADSLASPWLVSLTRPEQETNQGLPPSETQSQELDKQELDKLDKRQKFKAASGKKCIEAMLLGKVLPKYNRHDIGLRIIHELFSTGVPYQAASDKVSAWCDLVFAGESDKKARVQDTLRMLKEAYQKNEYNFGCYDDIKKDYCSAKCALFDKLDPEKRAEPLDITKKQKLALLKKDQGPSELELAENILKEIGECVTRSDEFFTWTGKYWRRLDRESFEYKIYQAARISLGETATDSKITSLARHVKACIPTAPENNNLFNPSGFLFNFADCTVSVTQTTQKDFLISQREHKQQDFLSYCHDFNFNGENTQLPHSGDFQEYMTHREKDLGPDGVRLLKQMLGACLIPFSPRIFILVGDSNSGKSTFLFLMKQLVGESNWSAVDPSDPSQFAWELGIGKLLNICTELDHQTPLKDNTLKRIRDRIPMAINRKGIKNIFGCLPPIHAYASNRLPKSLEGNSGALDKRLSIIKFKHIPSAYSNVMDLGKIIWERDARGVLLAAQEGLKDLLDNGFKYLSTQASLETLAEWQEESDPVKLFIKDVESGEYELPDPQSMAPKAKGNKEPNTFRAISVYQAYTGWRELRGFARMSHIRFYKELKRCGVNVFQPPDKLDGRLVSWEGLKIEMKNTENLEIPL